MAKKRKAGKRINRTENELGNCTFHCEKCVIEFEVEWNDTFSIQEATHGYVGFDLHDDYIACPHCGENANEKNFY